MPYLCAYQFAMVRDLCPVAYIVKWEIKSFSCIVLFDYAMACVGLFRLQPDCKDSDFFQKAMEFVLRHFLSMIFSPFRIQTLILLAHALDTHKESHLW